MRSDLTCIYEMHRLAKENEDEGAILLLTKVGKAHSTARTLRSYYSTPWRRGPFRQRGEDGPPPPSAINGHILCFIQRAGTLFDKARYPDLSNFLVEFIEAFATAALFPTIQICPAITQLGDATGQKDDPKFFAKVQRIMNLVIEGKFDTVDASTKKNNEDKKKHSEKEWKELIALTKFIEYSIKAPIRNGDFCLNRAEHLNQIGFHQILRENTRRNKRWIENFSDLRKHSEQKGFKNWPKPDPGKRYAGIRTWSVNQRERLGNLSGEKKEKNQWKIDLLNSIDFPWNDMRR